MHNLPRSSAALLRHYCRRMTDSLADTFDLGALRSPVAVHDVRRFDRAQGTPLGRRWKAKIVVCTLYLAAQAVFLSLYVPVAKLPSATADTITGAVFVLSGLLAAWWCAVAWRDAVRAVRVARAAASNGLDFDVHPRVVDLPGTAVVSLPGAVATHALRPRSAGRWPVFTAASVGPEFARAVRHRGIVAITLEVQTPHIVVHNRRARARDGFASKVRGGQRLRLEGDFDRTFSLYVPAGYERDALYVFTPDVMQRMLDVAADCQAELVDGWFVLTARRPWRLWREQEFVALLTMVSVLGTRVRSQTQRYRDDRSLRSGEVAPHGRRLRVRLSAGFIAAIFVPGVFVVAGLCRLLGLV